MVLSGPCYATQNARGIHEDFIEIYKSETDLMEQRLIYSFFCFVFSPQSVLLEQLKTAHSKNDVQPPTETGLHSVAVTCKRFCGRSWTYILAKALTFLIDFTLRMQGECN